MAKRSRRKSPQEAYGNAILRAQESGAPGSRYVSHMENGQREHAESEALYIRTTPIAWGIPMDEVMFSKFFVMWVRNGNFMPWDNFITTESTYLPSARNEIHNQYLETDYPYLMMIDSDVLFPPLMIERLIAHDLPIVGGWYKNKNRLKQYDPHPIVYDFVSEPTNFKHREKPGSGLERVDGMGAGCWLMTRAVAEALGRSPYDMNNGGEDLRLSKKLMELGIPLFVDWDIACAHIGLAWV